MRAIVTQRAGWNFERQSWSFKLRYRVIVTLVDCVAAKRRLATSWCGPRQTARARLPAATGKLLLPEHQGNHWARHLVLQIMLLLLQGRNLKANMQGAILYVCDLHQNGRRVSGSSLDPHLQAILKKRTMCHLTMRKLVEVVLGRHQENLALCLKMARMKTET